MLESERQSGNHNEDREPHFSLGGGPALPVLRGNGAYVVPLVGNLIPIPNPSNTYLSRY